jgi:hypothetical protein
MRVPPGLPLQQASLGGQHLGPAGRSYKARGLKRLRTRRQIRSTPQQAKDAIPQTAATYDNLPGREWKSLQDPTNDPIVALRVLK